MRKIIGFDNYLISENGVIINKKTGRVLKQFYNQKGYKFLRLSENGFSKTICVHREVYRSYKGDIPNDLEINHIDGNKSNNITSNLELVTRKENMVKAVVNGQIKSGSECLRSIPINQINVLNGDVIRSFGSIREATKLTGISGSGISNVINGKRITAGGYKWKKIE